MPGSKQGRRTLSHSFLDVRKETEDVVFVCACARRKIIVGRMMMTITYRRDDSSRQGEGRKREGRRTMVESKGRKEV